MGQGVQIIVGNALDELRKLPDESVDCCVTSPPYWGLRSYLEDDHADKPLELGLERTFQEHVTAIADVFDEVKRALKPTGTLWLNYGDSYATAPNGRSAADTKAAGTDDRTFRDKPFSTVQGVLKPKDLCGIPWRVAFALQERGWYLRQDIIWAKPNPMPESIQDRCTKAHEYIFLLAKRPRYYFDADAIAEGLQTDPKERYEERAKITGRGNQGAAAARGNDRGKSGGFPPRSRGLPPRHQQYLESSDQSGLDTVGRGGRRNKRSVWTVATQPFTEAHFATFPPALIEPCILAGCPAECCAACGAPYIRQIEKELVPTGKAAKTFVIDGRDEGADRNDQGSNRQKDGHKPGHAYVVTTLGFLPSCGCNAAKVRGVVLDPFGGAGTTGLVADRLGRDAILLELDARSAEIARRRIRSNLGRVQCDQPEAANTHGPLFDQMMEAAE